MLWRDNDRLATILLHGQPLRSFSPRLTRFSMSTTRALLPRPACYAPHKVASVVLVVVVVATTAAVAAAVAVAVAAAAAAAAAAVAVAAVIVVVVSRQLHVIVFTVDCLPLSAALRRWLDRLPSSLWSSSRWWLVWEKAGELANTCTLITRVKRRRHCSVAHAGLR